MNSFKRWAGNGAIAWSFLTRLPFPGSAKLNFAPGNLTGSMVFYPLVGLVFGLIAFAMTLAGTALQLDPTLTAFGLLLMPFLLNRFLHFDGVCDVLDGFLADRTPTERLAIMKDSRNGSFALGGAVLLLLGKYLLLLNLLETGFSALAVIAVAPILSRWILVPMVFRAHYPREQGTAQALVGRISGKVVVAASLVMLACLAGGLVLGGLAAGGWSGSLLGALLGWVGLAVGLGWVGLVGWMLWLRWLANRKIGGVTGDVLGCLCESGEALFLAVAFLVVHVTAST